MNRVDKLIAVAVITGILLLLFSLGFDFVRGADVGINKFPQMPSFDTKEPFTGGASAPTRAADCRCLPGYIPSRETSKDRVLFVKTDGLYRFIPAKSNEIYEMGGACNQCGQNFCAQAEEISNNELRSKINSSELIYKGYFNCSLIKPISPSDTYKCQNLSDSTDFKMCY